jgi:hypothetical protein
MISAGSTGLLTYDFSKEGVKQDMGSVYRDLAGQASNGPDEPGLELPASLWGVRAPDK